jgi:hypothetical protein
MAKPYDKRLICVVAQEKFEVDLNQFCKLVKRTSEFDARTTPKQTQVLDRTASPAKLLSP